MTVRIERHAYPNDDAELQAEIIGDGARDAIDFLEHSPGHFDSAFDSALTEAEARCGFDPTVDQAETWNAFVRAMEVGSALFAAAAAPDGVVNEHIDGRLRIIPAAGPREFADPGTWLQVFWLAAICRDRERMTRLCDVPTALLRESVGEGNADEFLYGWIDALRAHWLGGPDLGDRLNTAVNDCDPDTVHVMPPEMASLLYYPTMNLFARFVDEDKRGFHEALVDALERHQEYWSAEAEDHGASVDGLISLGSLGVACLAYDAGFPVEVETDYLPRSILDRSWVAGEATTCPSWPTS